MTEASGDLFPESPWLAYVGRPKPDTNFLEDVVYYLQKPEEVLTNILGRTFTDEVKYRTGSSSIYDANNFSTLLHSAGVGGEPSALGGNVLAAALGIGAAVLNPLDPINYIGIGSWTRKGLLAKLLQQTEVKTTRTGLRYIDEAAQLRKMEAAGATARQIDKTRRNIQVANRLLEKMPDSTELDLGKTFFERVRKGQQIALGLDPFQNPVLRLAAGVPRTSLSAGAVQVRAVDRAIEGVASPVGAVGGAAKDELVKVLNKFGANIPTDQMQRAVHKAFHALRKSVQGGKAANADDIKAFVHELAAEFPDQESRRSFFQRIREAVDILEVPEADLGTKQLLKEVLDTDEAVDRLIRQIGEPGSDPRPVRQSLTASQRSYLEPQEVDVPEELLGRIQEGSSAGAFPAPYGRRHKDSAHHVIAAPQDVPAVRSSVRRLAKLRINVPGIAPFRFRERGGMVYVYTQNLIERETQIWTPRHMQTLEKMAAMLSDQGYVLRDLDRRSFAIGADGSVQLIDPTLIVRAKKSEDAIKLNQTRLRQFAPQVGLPADMRFKALQLGKTQKVRATDFRFFDVAGRMEGVHGGKDLKYLRRQDLEEAVEWSDDLENLTEADRAEIESYLIQLRKSGSIEPVEISVDGYGRLHIRNSLNKIRALREFGVENVPAINVGFVGEVPKAGSEIVTNAPLYRAAEAIEKSPSPYSRLSAGRELLDESIRIVDPQAGFWEIDDLALRMLDREDLVGRVGMMLSRRSSTVPESRAFQQSFEIMERNFQRAIGADPAANLRLAVRLDQARNLDELGQILTEEMGIPVRFRGLSPNDQFQLQQEFLVLRQLAGDRLDRIAIEQGVFTPGREGLLGAFSRQTGQIALRSTDAGLEVFGVGFDLDRLAGLSEGLVAHGMNLADSERLILRGSDGTRVVRTGDLVRGTRPPRIPLVEETSDYFVSNTVRESFERNGITVGPEALSKALRGARSTLARSLQEGQTMAGFISPSGELIVGTQHRTVDSLLSAVYGDSEKHAQELLVITPKGIHVSNTLGMAGMGELTEKTLAKLSRRMQRVAQLLKKADFGDDVPIIFHTPIDPVVWREMYGTAKSTRDLGDVAKGSFRLQMPELAEGTSLKLIDSQGVIAARSRSQLVGPGPMRKLIDYLEKNFDDLFVSQQMAGLPIKYLEGYYARILHPKLQDQLDDLFRKFVASKGGSALQYWKGSQFKGRSLSDLTTEEITQLWREMKTNPEEILAFGSKSDHPFMQALAVQDLDTLEFFLVDNPLLSLKLARDKAVRSLAQKTAFEQLTDPETGIALFSGTGRQIDTWLHANDRLRNLDSELASTLDELESLSADHADMILREQDEGAIAAVEAEIARQEKRVAHIGKRRLEIVEQKAEAQVRLSGDITALREVIVSRDEAFRLMKEEGWEPELFRGNWKDPYMRIGVETMAERGLNTRVHVFHDEAIEAMERLHRLEAEPEEFLKRWEEVTNVWRRLTLFAPPSFIPYTSRNIFSNFLLGMVGGISTESYGRALPIFSRIVTMWRSSQSITEARKSLQDIRLYTPLGDPITGQQIWDEFVRHGGVSGGLHANEFKMDPSVLREMEEVGIPGSAELVGTSGFLDNKLLRFTQAIPQGQETFFRLAAFVDTLLKGGSFEDAGMAVKRIFYNYDELTAFERKVLRNVLPFYSWLRFNTPRMIQTMATNPVFHVRWKQTVARIEQGAGGPAQDEELTSFFKRMMPITLGRIGGKLFIVTADATVPMADAARVLFKEGGPFQIVEDGLTPLLKIPIELAVNKSLFSGRPISRFAREQVPVLDTLRTPEPARSFTLSTLGLNRGAEYVLSQVRPIKMTSQLLDTVLGQTTIRGERPVWWAGILDLTLTRLYQADPNRARMEVELRNEDLQASARWLMREGSRMNRRDLMEAGQRLLIKTALTTGREE